MSGMDVAAGICLIIGCLMSLGAGIGIVRFPDVLTRLHAGAKPQVFGLFMLLLGVGLAARSWTLVPLLVFVWVLQLVVIPVSSHMVGRSGFRNKHFRPESLSHNELADLVQRMSGWSRPKDCPFSTFVPTGTRWRGSVFLPATSRTSLRQP